jgi:ABC-2 type transport system permease protein
MSAIQPQVFRQALRASMRTALLCALGMGAFMWVIMLSSSLFASDTGNIPTIVQDPPRAIVALFGGAANLLEPEGWLAAGLVHPIVMSLFALGAFMVPAASGITELERGTLDLVLSRPISRSQVLFAKAAAMVVTLATVTLGGIAGTLVARVTIAGSSALSLTEVALSFAGQFLLFLTFGVIALWLFARGALRSRALGATIGILIGSFLINFLSLLFDALEPLGYVTPFRYFRAASVLAGNAWLPGFAVLIGASVVILVMARRVFTRRDLSR